MRLQYASFSLPLHSGSTEQEDLNRFLRGHRVVQTRKELVSDEGNSRWAILVEYLEAQGKGDSDRQTKGKVDYREVLSPADFSMYSKLRDARKKLAEEGGLPVYAVCTNEQLAEIAKRRPASLTDCMKIEGIGQGKAEKYLPALLECVKTDGETPAPPPF
ncbi:MAG: HRDC domain-containing protein [Treponema sp.]|nr:HRDC domain-containing protein [Treponema sp.]